jgi:hypothetical protein
VDLAAELCLDRNHRASLALSDLYSYELIYNIITNDRVEFGLKAKFVKLLLNLHIDKDPFEKLNVPNMTRIWNEIGQPDEARIQYTQSTIPNSIV